jgi:hypothetical protein
LKKKTKPATKSGKSSAKRNKAAKTDEEVVSDASSEGEMDDVEEQAKPKKKRAKTAGAVRCMHAYR